MTLMCSTEKEAFWPVAVKYQPGVPNTEKPHPAYEEKAIFKTSGGR